MTFADVLNGTEPNGTWHLYVYESENGDGGMNRRRLVSKHNGSCTDGDLNSDGKHLISVPHQTPTCPP